MNNSSGHWTRSSIPTGKESSAATRVAVVVASVTIATGWILASCVLALRALTGAIPSARVRLGRLRRDTWCTIYIICLNNAGNRLSADD
ncbi:hypothetical protein AVEN_143313-1 [Araneus ventricosus]|uniref:Uncharacterized protein n=1 Tax=Araneus ventricosus TaxID=182803 RepID=A0A4Y2AFJ1_ARAVE|nr:hypothetical protein AVEN_143313-1 [Araneus ventricosus]